MEPESPPKRVKWTSEPKMETTLESLPDELTLKIIKMAAASDRTDSVIAGDFGAMSAAEQESQRAQWKEELESQRAQWREELTRTEEEIARLRQLLAAKEATAAGLKRRLGKLLGVTNV